jgi:hypothetical protein
LPDALDVFMQGGSKLGEKVRNLLRVVAGHDLLAQVSNLVFQAALRHRVMSHR